MSHEHEQARITRKEWIEMQAAVRLYNELLVGRVLPDGTFKKGVLDMLDEHDQDINCEEEGLKAKVKAIHDLKLKMVGAYLAVAAIGSIVGSGLVAGIILLYLRNRLKIP